MNVYVVVEWYPYEGNEIQGVFSSKEEAIKFCKNHEVPGVAPYYDVNTFVLDDRVE